MKNCEKCDNLKIDAALEIDNFWSDWSEVGYDGSVWKFKGEKLYLLLTEKEAELTLEITKKNNQLLKKDSKIAELELKLNKLELGEMQTEINQRMKQLEILVNNLNEITKTNQLEINNLYEENSYLKQQLSKINESKLRDEKQYELIGNS